jgi:hypothetical protein
MMACRDELELIVPKRRNGKEGKAKCRFLRDLPGGPLEGLRRAARG